MPYHLSRYRRNSVFLLVEGRVSFFPFMNIHLSLSLYIFICSLSGLVCLWLQSDTEELGILCYFKCLIKRIESFDLGFEWPRISFFNWVVTGKIRGNREKQRSWEADIISGKPYPVELSPDLKITDSYNKNY